MDTPDETIRATVRALLAHRNQTGGLFADMIGMKRATFYSRMAGDTEWSAAEVARAAEALGVTVATLYTGLQVPA